MYTPFCSVIAFAISAERSTSVLALSTSLCSCSSRSGSPLLCCPRARICDAPVPSSFSPRILLTENVVHGVPITAAMYSPSRMRRIMLLYTSSHSKFPLFCALVCLFRQWLFPSFVRMLRGRRPSVVGPKIGVGCVVR